MSKTNLQFTNIIASMNSSLIKSDRIAKVDAALSEARQVILSNLQFQFD